MPVAFATAFERGAPSEVEARGAAPAGGAGEPVEVLDHHVDGVLGHLAVGRELAAGDGDDARLGAGDLVPAREVGGATARRRLHERTQARPGAEHVGLGERLPHRQVDGPEQVGDVVGGALRVVDRAVVVGVGGADVGELEAAVVGRQPRHHEHAALVLRDRAPPPRCRCGPCPTAP